MLPQPHRREPPWARTRSFSIYYTHQLSSVGTLSRGPKSPIGVLDDPIGVPEISWLPIYHTGSNGSGLIATTHSCLYKKWYLLVLKGRQMLVLHVKINLHVISLGCSSPPTGVDSNYCGFMMTGTVNGARWTVNGAPHHQCDRVPRRRTVRPIISVAEYGVVSHF